MFDPEPAEATAEFNDPLLDLPNVWGTHHIGASTEQAQEAIAEEAIRIIRAFVKTGAVLPGAGGSRRTTTRSGAVSGSPGAGSMIVTTERFGTIRWTPIIWESPLMIGAALAWILTLESTRLE